MQVCLTFAIIPTLFEIFFQALLSGLAVGSLYALIALGYTMVYGILKFINFAHSDVFVLGAWISYEVAKSAGWLKSEQTPWYAGIVVLVAAMFMCAVVGFAIERFAYKPLRKAPRLNVLITAIGVSLLLQNLGQVQWIADGHLSFVGKTFQLPFNIDVLFGTRPQGMPVLLQDRELASIGGSPEVLNADGTVLKAAVPSVIVRLVDVIGAGTALVLMFLLDRLVFHTRLGRAMRAVSHNANTASLMGINVDRVISITFIIGASLAAAAGFLYSQKYSGLNQPAAAGWVLLGLKAFVAAVVGGIGNIRGAMLGGILIGLLEFFGMTYFGPELRDVYVFALLILVLLFRPGGLLGKATIEKV